MALITYLTRIQFDFGALGDHCHLSTPRQPTKAEYIELIEQSWG